VSGRRVSPDELLARHREVLPKWLALYYERPIELVRGSGTTVWDSEDNEYLDMFGGIVTTISGHAVESIVDALRAQADQIAHTSTLYLIEPMVRLAERLVELAPTTKPAKAFFVGSGTEAVEAALLMATAARRSNQVIALRNSYHGRSFTAVSVTGNRAWGSTSLSPLNVSYALAPYCYRCPLSLTYPSCGVACAEDVRNVIETTTSGDVAAMIAEPIQGVGGFITPPREYFAKVKAILDDYEIPLILDEVQTGFGRTGEAFWGSQAYDVTPDLITCAKGLGNGMSIGAVVGDRDLVDSITANSISTFGGNPLATTVALANLDFLEDEGLQGNAERVGKLLREGLDDLRDRHEIVGDVRGKGLMVGVELVVDAATKAPNPDAAAEVMEGCRRRGVLVGKGGMHGSVLRLAPPLTLTEDEARRAVHVLDDAIADAASAGDAR
jgi:4-aminobutyrate aminotransferase